MGDFGREFFGFLTLIVGAAILALLVGHASNVASLISSGTTGLNTLLNTVENPGGSSNSVGSILGGAGNILGGLGSLGTSIGSLSDGGSFGGTAGLVLGGNGSVDVGTFD